VGHPQDPKAKLMVSGDPHAPVDEGMAEKTVLSKE
jgi:hypothetical protein